RARAALAPRRREPEIDERAAPLRPHDDVRRLHVAVQEARAMQRRQLVRCTRERLEPFARIRRLEARLLANFVEASPFDELAHHVTPAVAERAEREHARHAEPLETRERDGLAHERDELELASVLGEHLERARRARDEITDGPNFAAASLPEAMKRFVPRR